MILSLSVLKQNNFSKKFTSYAAAVGANMNNNSKNPETKQQRKMKKKNKTRKKLITYIVTTGTRGCYSIGIH